MTDATVYADGSCIGNPGPGGWGVHVQFSDGRIEDLGGGELRTTNNRMELRAAIEAVLATTECEAVTVIVDSEYVKKGITSWVAGWKKNGWRTREGNEVSNRELWEALDQVADKRITWQWTRAHVGTAGNERVDTIARWFAGNMVRTRTRGAPRPAPARTEDREPPRGSLRGNGSGAWYLSSIDGVAMRHRTWPDCQDRVNGVPRAKFRKVQSDDEERKVLQEWGVRPDQLHELEFVVKPPGLR